MAAAANPPWTQQQRLIASDGAAGGYFGTSVSVDGDTAVIGAHVGSGTLPAVYVFVRIGGVWSQQAELTASDRGVGDVFGSSVSVSGDTAVTGAFGKSSSQGVAYVFVRSGTTWSQQQELTASDRAADDQFGYSVAVSGDTALIGANTKFSGQGAAYVFVRSGSTWSQQQKLSVPAVGGQFGTAVSLSGQTAVIAAPYANGSQGGVALVFVSNGASWSEQQELTAISGRWAAPSR
jgi:hypothetical protein